jgi:hypothetical protein
MFLNVRTIWAIIVLELFTLGSATPNPCIAYSDNLMYFIYPNSIITFDTSNNQASTQTLSAGPSGDNVCAQQPGTDSVVIGKVSSVIDEQGKNLISSKYMYAQIEPSTTTPLIFISDLNLPSGETLAIFSLRSLTASYVPYTQTGDAPLLTWSLATPSATFLNSTCLFAITPFNSTFGAFLYIFNSPTLNQGATVTSYVINTNGIDMTSLAHAGIAVVNGNLYIAGGYASNAIYSLNGMSLQKMTVSGTLPTGAISATGFTDAMTNKQLVAMISASDPSIWMFDPFSNILQNSATGPQNFSELTLGSTGQQLLAFDPNWGKMQKFFPNNGSWIILNATVPFITPPTSSSLPTDPCTPLAPMTQSDEAIGDPHAAAKIGVTVAGGIVVLVFLSSMVWLCHRRRRRAIRPTSSDRPQLDTRVPTSDTIVSTMPPDTKPEVKRYNFNAKIPSFRMLNTSAIAVLYPASAKHASNNISANPTAPEGTIMFTRYELIQSVRLNSLADGTAFRVARDIKRFGSLVILKFMIDQNDFDKDLSTTRYLKSSYVTTAIDSFELPSSITQHRYISIWQYRPSLASLMNDGRLERNDHALLRKSARSLCEAVQWIHSKGIVHLQLQPASIVHERNNPSHWLITDFQHACALTVAGNDVVEPIDWSLTLNAYSAPDMFQNGKHAPPSIVSVLGI